MSVSEIVQELRAVGERRVLSDGEVLCREGEQSRGAFIVLSGALDAVIEVDGIETTIANHGPDTLVGEVTTVVGGARTATLRAARPTTVAVIDQPTLASWLDDHPEVARSVLDIARERTDRNRAAALLAEHLGIDDPHLAVAIAIKLSIESHPVGDVLFARHDDPAVEPAEDPPTDRAGVVISGRISLEVEGGDARDVGRGDLIGPEGLFGERRTRTATAIRDSTVGWLSRDDFAQLTVDHPLAMVDIVRRIAVERAGPVTELGRSVAVVTLGDDRDAARRVVEGMTAGIARMAKVIELTADRVDDMLGTAGVALVSPDRPGDRRVQELLHQAEVEHAAVVLHATEADGPWLDRVVRHADQIVVWSNASTLSSSAVSVAGDEAMIERLVSSVSRRSPIWLAAEHRAGISLPSGTRWRREYLGVDEVHHIRDGSTEDLGRIGRLAAGLGIGLVLSGGGGRGFAHIGAYRSLVEHDVPVDRIGGASMGSAIAGAIGLGLVGEPLVAMVEDQFRGLLDYTVPLVSVLKGGRIAAAISDTFSGRDIEDLWIPFSCVTTNLTKNRVDVRRTGPLDRAIRASVAIPGVLPPVPDGDDLLIDGGVLDNLPLGLATNDPSIGTIIAVDVAPPTGPRARADFGMSVSGWSAMRDRLRRNRRQLPTLSSVLMRSMTVGSALVRDQRLQTGVADLYLYLDLAGVGLLDFDSVRTVADRGYEAADPAIQEWLAEGGFAPA